MTLVEVNCLVISGKHVQVHASGDNRLSGCNFGVDRAFFYEVVQQMRSYSLPSVFAGHSQAVSMKVTDTTRTFDLKTTIKCFLGNKNTKSFILDLLFASKLYLKCL